MFTGIFWGVVATILAAAIFYTIKPKLEIATMIARRQVGAVGMDGDDIYFIKIINHSFFRACDFKYSISVGVWVDDVMREVEVETTHIPVDSIAPYAVKDRKAQYAIRIGFRMPQLTSLPADARILFKCSATHPFTNAKGSFSKEYKLNDIQIGEYKTGLSMAIDQPVPANA